MISKIEMQAMDAVIGIHREMRKANEKTGNSADMKLPKACFR